MTSGLSVIFASSRNTVGVDLTASLWNHMEAFIGHSWFMLNCTNSTCIYARLSYLVWLLLLSLRSHPKKEEFLDAGYMTLLRLMIKGSWSTGSLIFLLLVIWNELQWIRCGRVKLLAAYVTCCYQHKHAVVFQFLVWYSIWFLIFCLKDKVTFRCCTMS